MKVVSTFNGKLDLGTPSVSGHAGLGTPGGSGFAGPTVYISELLIIRQLAK